MGSIPTDGLGISYCRESTERTGALWRSRSGGIMRVASCAPYCTPAGWYCWPAGWYYMAGIPLSKRCCGTLEIRDSFTDTVHRDEVYTVTPRGTSGAMKHAFLPQVDTMMMAWCNSGACGRGDLEQWDAVSIGARRDRYGQNLKSATSVSIFAPCYNPA